MFNIVTSIETASGVVTEARSAGVYTFNVDIVEGEGTNAKNYFADNCKIIVKNGDAYTAGNVDSLIVAKKTDSVFNNNIKYVLDTNNEFAYIIIDLAK